MTSRTNMPADTQKKQIGSTHYQMLSINVQYFRESRNEKKFNYEIILLMF